MNSQTFQDGIIKTIDHYIHAPSKIKNRTKYKIIDFHNQNKYNNSKN